MSYLLFFIMMTAACATLNLILVLWFCVELG